MRILFIEDQKKAGEAMMEFCDYLDIDCEVAGDGKRGLELAKQPIFDVIVLDLMLPELPGLEVLSQLRSSGITTPVLVLTALGSIEDKMLAFDLGADDYVVKPFSARELFARIKALARRPENEESENQNIVFEDIAYDPIQKKFISKVKEKHLTDKESRVLELFIKNPNVIFSREEILNIVWGEKKSQNKNNVEIYIHHLRKVLEGTGAKITTVRGRGYMLESAPKAE